MYQPTHHREDRLDVQHALIQSHPFGLLISSGTDGLLANAIPFMLQPTLGSLGTLEAHMARANGQWRDIDGQQVLVVRRGIVSSYQRRVSFGNMKVSGNGSEGTSSAGQLPNQPPPNQ